MKKYFLLFNIGLVLSFLLCIVACKNERNKADEIKLISFNIRLSSMAKYDGENRWDNRKQAIIKMIEQEQPDVFGLQEALLEQVEYLKTNLPQYKNIGVGRDDGENKGEFMSIFYLSDKFDLLKSGNFWLSKTPEIVSKGWDAACYRIVTWAQLQDKQSKANFYYFNTHFDHEGIVARENSAKLVSIKIMEIAGNNSSVVFGGDLNSEISDPIFNPLKEFMKVVREDAPITDNKGTYNGFGTTTNQVIDHIFCRNVKSKVFKTLDFNYGVSYISDHYPIECVFELD